MEQVFTLSAGIIIMLWEVSFVVMVGFVQHWQGVVGGLHCQTKYVSEKDLYGAGTYVEHWNYPVASSFSSVLLLTWYYMTELLYKFKQVVVSILVNIKCPECIVSMVRFYQW